MRTVELFAGTGGMALGVSMAGFKHDAVIERDSDCCKTIRANQTNGHPIISGWPLYQNDIRQFDFSILNSKPDLLTGGPPCQPFSLGGKCRGHKDKRDMFPEAIRAVRELQPKTFIFENVKGLTRTAFLNYFEYIRLQLTFPSIVKLPSERWTHHHERLEQHFTNGRHNPEYRVLVHSFNTADYGIPQKRERVVLIGLRSDLNAEWSFPAPSHSSGALLISKWKTKAYWDRHLVPKRNRPPTPNDIESILARLSDSESNTSLLPWTTIRDTISDLPRFENKIETARLNHHFIGGARIYTGHSGSLIDEPAKALKAGSHGVPGGENMLLAQDGTVRYFTVRECARLQCFPDNYTLPCSWTSNTRQIGNAVPVLFAQKLAESLRGILV